VKDEKSDMGMFWNRIWIFVGLLPFIPSILLAMFSHSLFTAIAPIYGFCPLDVLHVQSSPPSQQILIWGIVSGTIFIAFAIYAFL
jgi:hypothetical protein